MSCKINPHILRYIEMVESGKLVACEDQKLLVAHVRRCFETESLRVDDEQIEHYLGMAKYFPFDQLFPWQEFVIALHDCVYRPDGLPRWPDLFCMIGRGAGKDGTIALESACLMGPYNNIPEYDVDICANNEDQAMRPVRDFIGALETPKNTSLLKRFFRWTKEYIICLLTKSVMKGRTNSPKGKDGLRSGIVIFNEIHQYENYANINVFTTGLGKKKHPRRSYYTTNGDVRDGPLDDLLETSDRILRQGEPDNGLLPFICRLDSKEEVHDPANWPKANPSLPYLPNLLEEIKKEYAEWVRNPAQLPAFMTKRMNLPESNREVQVTAWENIKATNHPLPDLTGRTCSVGIDFAKTSDWAAINLHFFDGETRHDINHAWICLQSPDLPRIRAPWKDWAREGHLTPVDNVEIPTKLLVDYIDQAASLYNIPVIALDNYRYSLIAMALREIGFDAKDHKNVRLVKSSDIARVVPVIDSAFLNQTFVWGDNPVLRWATNNTKLVRNGRDTGEDFGNFRYAKIEARSRKTDPFMALVASMTVEDEIVETKFQGVPDFGTFVY